MTRLDEIKARCEAADKAVCEVAKDPAKFKMTIPSLPTDTDELVTTICRTDIPWLIAEVERLQKRVDELEKTQTP